MNRYIVQLFSICCSLAAISLSCFAAERPNVVIIISDDQGWADIGYHNPEVYTPNLDKLAESGIRLTNHYVMPQCTPTRVALLTGRYPGRFSKQALVASNEPVIPHGTATIATMLQKLGYDTQICGKWHLGSMPEYGPNHFGFDHSYGSLAGAVGMYNHLYKAGGHPQYDPTWHRDHEIIPGYENGTHVTDLISREAIRFIEKKRTTPFFLYLAFHAPHLPLDERGEFIDTPTQPDPDNPKRWLNEDKIKWFNDPAGIIQSEPSRDKRLLLATVYHLDSAIGDIVKALERSGQRENTLIMFSSDNGPWRNSNGGGYPDDIPLKDYNQPAHWRGRKLDVWEGGVHVAGFINWPDRIKSGQLDTPVHIVDWFPTLARIVDYQAAAPISWDGIDLSPAIFKDDPLPDRDIYWIWHPQTDRWALLHHDWKIVRYSRKEPSSPEDWQLYNLRLDPEEKNNLAKDYPDLVKAMHQRFVVHRKKDHP